LVLFGGGDLSSRLIVPAPALFNLHLDGQLPEDLWTG